MEWRKKSVHNATCFKSLSQGGTRLSIFKSGEVHFLSPGSLVELSLFFKACVLSLKLLVA